MSGRYSFVNDGNNTLTAVHGVSKPKRSKTMLGLAAQGGELTPRAPSAAITGTSRTLLHMPVVHVSGGQVPEVRHTLCVEEPKAEWKEPTAPFAVAKNWPYGQPTTADADKALARIDLERLGLKPTPPTQVLATKQPDGTVKVKGHQPKLTFGFWNPFN